MIVFGEQTFDALLAIRPLQIIVEARAGEMRREHVRITVDTRRHLRRNTTLRCSWLMAIRDPAVLYAAQSVRIQADDSEMTARLSLTEDYDMSMTKPLQLLRTKRVSASCLHESMCS